ncbi:hypothetical protein H5T56_04920 [Candidatus Bipolaricaulota bacterium]|nr:hypothetical protein [Candidatus Bipolaricaulota bacterium]
MLPELYCGGGARAAARLRAQALLSGRLGLHPDFFSVESEGRWLGIGEVRALALWARYAPVAGPRRVALLGPAERLTPEAANALLKLLEEVPPYLALILYGEAPDRVIPTVRSRCSLRFSPSPKEAWQEALRRAGYDPRETEFLLSLCEEREDELENFLDPKRDVFRELVEAEEEARGLPLSELFLRFSGEAADPLRRRAFAEVILEGLLRAPTFEVLRAAEVLSRTGALHDFLWELLKLLRERLAKEEAKSSRALLVSWARKVSLARGEMEANANQRLLAEVVLLWPRKGLER